MKAGDIEATVTGAAGSLAARIEDKPKARGGRPIARHGGGDTSISCAEGAVF